MIAEVQSSISRDAPVKTLNAHTNNPAVGLRDDGLFEIEIAVHTQRSPR